MTESKDSVISDIKRIFSEGDENIVLSNNKKVILILGNSGSGKSTLAQLLAGDNDKLIAKEKTKGLRDYWIYDENNKISRDDTLLSKTIFPDLVVDPITNAAFYDCPGFNDNRNSSVDIGGTYFIRKIINHVEEVKIILVVNYNSLRQGENRIDFPTLLTHSTSLIKNIDKFKESILLVASKVENEPVENPETGDYDEIGDEDVVKGIATFIKIAKNTFNQKVIDSQSDKDRKTNKDIVKLLDIFLATQGENYKNIGLFRKSDMEGKVSQIELLQKNKKNINHLIHNSLKYTRKNDEDFGYTISPTSHIFIKDLVDQINRELTETLTSVAKEITTLYKNKEKIIRDIYDLQQQLNEGSKNFAKFLHKIKDKEHPKTIIIEIAKGLVQWNIEISKKNEMNNIANQYDHLDFLQKLANKELTLTKQKIIEPFEQALINVERASYWYDFFINFYKKLFSYEVQEDGRKYDEFVETVNQWKRNKSIVLGFDMKKGMMGIVNKVNGFYAIENLEMDELKLDVLNDLVESALKNNVNSTCIGDNKLQFRGTWIKTSDLDNTDYDKCSGHVDNFEVFALKGFVIDSSFQRSGAKVIIIAPTWYIMRYNEINISGYDGNNQPQAKKGKCPSGIGENGRFGLSGTSAGKFLGIGSKFVNGKQLKILANAGSGGNGQQGGDGCEGNNGENNSCTWYDGRPNVFRNGLRCTVTSPEDGFHIGDDSDGKLYRLKGGPGKVGGKSGHGGMGGPSGRMGNIVIYQLNGNSNIETEVKSGYKGKDGKPGTPGSPGHDGNSCTGYYYRNFWGVKYWHKIKCGIPFGKFAKRAQSGISGAGTNGPRDKAVESPNHTEAITKYQEYIKQNFNDRFNLKEYPEFYWKLNSKPKLLINEGNGREKRSIKFNETGQLFGKEDLFFPNVINSQENLNSDSKNILNFKFLDFTLNNTLLLMDLVIKKLTGGKPIDNILYDNNQNSMETLAISLNIIEKFENLLAKFTKSEKINKKCLTIDFSSLVGKIQTELLKDDNFERIAKILYDSVSKNDCHELKDNEISNKFKKIITKMVKNVIE